MDIQKEQDLIKDKIRRIKENNIFYKIKDCLGQFRDSVLDNSHTQNITILGRLKKVDSAVDKIAQKNIPATEIYDLLAYMIVVDLPENYESAKQQLQTHLPGVTFLHDFDGNSPENNGYSSFHLGVNLDSFFNEYGIEPIPNLEKLPAEIQLKSYGMYMAQECTHDSIYKNNNLSKEQKQDMQTLMFPMIEYLTDIEMYKRVLNATVDEETRKSYEEKILATKKKVQAHKNQHSDYINQNMDQIDDVFREYIARKYIETLKTDVNSKLSTEEIEGLLSTVRNALDSLSKPQSTEKLTDTEPTGFKNVDTLLSTFGSMSLEDIDKLAKENVPPLLQSTISASESFVTAIDMKRILEMVHACSLQKQPFSKKFTNER